MVATFPGTHSNDLGLEPCVWVSAHLRLGHSVQVRRWFYSLLACIALVLLCSQTDGWAVYREEGSLAFPPLPVQAGICEALDSWNPHNSFLKSIKLDAGRKTRCPLTFMSSSPPLSKSNSKIPPLYN